MFEIRHINYNELAFLNEMLYQAIFVPEGKEPLPKSVIEHPDIAKYIDNYGREGDICLVAEDEGKLVGAAWTRIFSEQDKGYGFVDPKTPELSMAVLPGYRGVGIGSKLLGKMLDELKKQGYNKVSLSVDKINYAYNLYKLFGFQEFFSSDTSETMVKTLSS